MKMMDLMLTYFIMLIMVLMTVGFFTLLERKILSYINNRKGPNKVGIMGLAQPISDGMKLFLKEFTIPYLSLNLMFMIAPAMIFILSLFMWSVLPLMNHFMDFSYGFLFFMCLTGLNVYSLILSGWSSNSKYSIYGAYRGVAQTISYEVSLALLMLSLVYLIESYNFEMFKMFQNYSWFIFLMTPLSMIWLVSMLAETNRTPFDFTEGESELVSGFNIEYGSFFFALIFIGEYSSIIFMSSIYVILFLGGMNTMFFIKTLMIMLIFLLIRGTLPRFRYDNLMYLAWKIYLPMSINFLIFYFSLKLIINTILT